MKHKLFSGTEIFLEYPEEVIDSKNNMTNTNESTIGNLNISRVSEPNSSTEGRIAHCTQG